MPLSEQLLAALRTPPQDLERFLVLADRLQAEGDVRGELIMLHARRLEAADPTELIQVEERFLAEHAKALLGRLWTSPSSCLLNWELGFIRHAMLWAQELDAEQQRQLPGRPPLGAGPRRKTGKLARLTRDLLEVESAALLESLTLGLPRSEVQHDRFLGAVAEVVDAAPPTLRLLQLRDLVEDEDPRYAGFPPEERAERAMREFAEDTSRYQTFLPGPWRLPDYEPGRMRSFTWRGRPMTVSADSFPLDAVIEVLAAWE